MARRAGGRGAKASESRPAIEQLPWQQPRLNYSPIEVVSADELEAIHVASLRVLSELGMVCTNPEARQVFKRGGADVNEETEVVKLDKAIIEQCIASAPAQFTFHARNPAHSLQFGGNHLMFAAVASPPNSGDMVTGRRTGNQEDFQNLVKMSQYFNAVHLNGGYPVEPTDIHASVRHLHCLADIATLTDKPFHVYSLGKERNDDGLEIARIVHGLTHDELLDNPLIMSIINTNSPMKLDTPMAQGIMELARTGQISVITPFTLAGAMAPVTIAGACVQQNAEALFGVTLSQLTRAGSPVVYGGFTSNVDMKSGAPAFGTPEYMKAAHIGGQLARRYGLPYRSSGVNASNTVDAQAGYESVFSLWGSIMGGGNLIMHSAGWLEGGLRASMEKFALDVDLLQMLTKYLEPLDLSDDALGIDAIRDVGPGGHFFGTPHTQSRYTDAFYSPLISDWRNFESWEEAGSPTAIEKAHKVYKAALADYQQPYLQEDRAEELAAFVAKRVEQGGVKTDF
ncbi:MAG: trimethylamine methyltransferase family protein [Alphaproteobacteria bacterium]